MGFASFIISFIIPFMEREKFRVKIKEASTGNEILIPFLILFFILLFIFPDKIKVYHSYVHWNTIWTLFGLLIITTGIKESGFLVPIARRVLARVKTERALGFYLVLLSTFLSMFLTNDIALFIVIPFIIELKKVIKNNIEKFVVFQAIAVNVGSALSPIGNPQNIFLWHRSGVSFPVFAWRMFPIFLIMFTVLILFVYVFFPPRKLVLQGICRGAQRKRRLLIMSIILLPVYILLIDRGIYYISVGIVFALYLLIERRILLKIDYPLILLFVIMFIEFNLLSQIPPVSNLVKGIDLSNSRSIFGISILLSQIISNVPVSIFMAGLSSKWLPIAYGVNLGGNGFFIASLANVIALRFIKDRKIYALYHIYAIPFIILTTGITLLLWGFLF